MRPDLLYLRALSCFLSAADASLNDWPSSPGGGQTVDRFAAAGVDGGKAAHGTIRARGVALQRNVALLTCESQRAAHRR